MAGVMAAMGTVEAQVLTQIGVTDLRNRYGASLPEGTGIVGWLTEAGFEQTIDSTVYRIFWANLTAPSLNTGRSVTLYGPAFPPSPASYWSDHASTVAGAWYGGPSQGVSPDLSSVVQMFAGTFVGSGALQAGSITAPVVDPLLPMPKVVNASWAVSFPVAGQNEDVLRRIDYLVDRDGVTVVVAAGNTPGVVPAALPGQGYNSITVGLSSGTSSGGLSTVDGTGRLMVDVVAPSGVQSSYAAPLVAGAAVLIADRAQETPALANADDPRVVRSLIMTGAEKLAGWSNTSTQPLHPYQGAGELRVNRSYDVLMAGETTVGAVSRDRGWDLGIGAVGVQYYYVDTTYNGGNLAVTLAWNRVTGDPNDPTGADRTNPANFTVLSGTTVLAASALADLNLEVLTTDGVSTPLTSLAVSQSTVDNVEHIYLTGLAPGRYAIGVSGGSGTMYGLSFNFVPEVPVGWPMGVGAVVMMGWVVRRRVRGR
jgi:hypothetical protein